MRMYIHFKVKQLDGVCWLQIILSRPFNTLVGAHLSLLQSIIKANTLD